MRPPVDIVIGGTKPFALALFAPLTERAGSRPRIAPEPAQALALCAASSGLLVVEYAPAWLPVLQQLRQRAPGLRVVAALPRGQEAAALALAPLGAEAVPWEGQAAAVTAAVDRLLGGAPAAAPLPPPSVKPAAAPAVTPAAGVPAQPAPPRLSPAPSAVPVASRPPAVTPLAGTPAQAAPRPPAVTPPAGTPAQAAPRPPTAPPPAAIVPPAPAPAPPAPADDLFDGLEPADPTAERPVAPAAAPLPAAPPPYTGPAAEPAEPAAAAWPSQAPGEDEAESALVLYSRGKLRADAPLAAVTRQTLASMSELERQVIAGAALPFDAAPVYRAAVMRLRVAAAIAAAPPPPAAVDQAAVQAILGELDGLLAKVNPLAAGAPPEHQPALESVRNALVREAVDFSEAAHRLTQSGPPPAPEASARPARAPAAATSRVLSVQAGDDGQAAEERRRRGPLITLVVVLLAIAAVLGWQQLSKPPLQAPASYDGAPANTMAVANGPHRVLLALPGKTVDAGELDRFKRQEEKKGNTVTEVAPGNWLIAPAAPPTPGKEGTP